LIVNLYSCTKVEDSGLVGGEIEYVLKNGDREYANFGRLSITEVNKEITLSFTNIITPSYYDLDLWSYYIKDVSLGVGLNGNFPGTMNVAVLMLDGSIKYLKRTSGLPYSLNNITRKASISFYVSEPSNVDWTNVAEIELKN
jgi:hypothetical protein